MGSEVGGKGHGERGVTVRVRAEAYLDNFERSGVIRYGKARIVLSGLRDAHRADPASVVDHDDLGALPGLVSENWKEDRRRIRAELDAALRKFGERKGVSAGVTTVHGVGMQLVVIVDGFVLWSDAQSATFDSRLWETKRRLQLHAASPEVGGPDVGGTQVGREEEEPGPSSSPRAGTAPGGGAPTVGATRLSSSIARAAAAVLAVAAIAWVAKGLIEYRRSEGVAAQLRSYSIGLDLLAWPQSPGPIQVQLDRDSPLETLRIERGSIVAMENDELTTKLIVAEPLHYGMKAHGDFLPPIVRAAHLVGEVLIVTVSNDSHGHPSQVRVFDAAGALRGALLVPGHVRCLHVPEATGSDPLKLTIGALHVGAGHLLDDHDVRGEALVATFPLDGRTWQPPPAELDAVFSDAEVLGPGCCTLMPRSALFRLRGERPEVNALREDASGRLVTTVLQPTIERQELAVRYLFDDSGRPVACDVDSGALSHLRRRVLASAGQADAAWHPTDAIDGRGLCTVRHWDGERWARMELDP